MMSVDVGFLSIPGVVPNNLQNGILTITPQMTILRSLSEATTTISLGASVGSTMISLLLMRHNRTTQVENYLFQTSRRYFGLEPMAIVFSLPGALLMWSCVISCIPTLLLWNTDTPDRILMFDAGFFCYCYCLEYT